VLRICALCQSDRTRELERIATLPPRGMATRAVRQLRHGRRERNRTLRRHEKADRCREFTTRAVNAIRVCLKLGRVAGVRTRALSVRAAEEEDVVKRSGLESPRCGKEAARTQGEIYNVNE